MAIRRAPPRHPPAHLRWRHRHRRRPRGLSGGSRRKVLPGWRGRAHREHCGGRGAGPPVRDDLRWPAPGSRAV